MKEKSKTQDVIDHLKKYGSISQIEAAKYYYLYRLGSVIFSLRKRGYKIITEDKEFEDVHGRKSSCAIYHLVEEE